MVPACDAAVVAGSAAIVSTSARTWLIFLVVNRFIVFMVIHFIVVVARNVKTSGLTTELPEQIDHITQKE